MIIGVSLGLLIWELMVIMKVLVLIVLRGWIVCVNGLFFLDCWLVVKSIIIFFFVGWLLLKVMVVIFNVWFIFCNFEICVSLFKIFFRDLGVCNIFSFMSLE